MDIRDFQKKVAEFRDARDWKQFHNPKDLAAAISIEASELQERFLWKTNEEAYSICKNDVGIQEEVADVLNYLLLFCDACGIDIEKAFLDKLEKNNHKYSVDKAKGKSDKYDKL